MIIIALEGLPCAGKTTFFNRFITENTSFHFIPELYIEIENNDTSISIREKYSNAELIKKSKLKNNDVNVISDRSFLSSLAFSYAMYKLKGNRDDHDYNLNFLEKNINNIIIPNFVFVFLIPPTESLRRRKLLERDNSQEVFQNQYFLQYFSEFYKIDDFHKIVPKEKVIFVDTLANTNEEVYSLVRKEIVNLLRN